MAELGGFLQKGLKLNSYTAERGIGISHSPRDCLEGQYFSRVKISRGSRFPKGQDFSEVEISQGSRFLGGQDFSRVEGNLEVGGDVKTQYNLT